MLRFALIFAFPWLAAAQYIPAGQPIPKTSNPPVVFLNGYQFLCGGTSFTGAFANAGSVLQANGLVSLFFDNCTVSGKPSIEALGIAFGQFLSGLKYTDGTAVPSVDVVAHSMGGLIVRSYLAGKKDGTPASFAPPANPGIRKLIFLGTPHFGSGLAAAFGFDTQSKELTVGSQFLFDLNTWNQGTDDLRGVDALAVAGNLGTGNESSIKGFDDGVVTLTSSSLGFVRTGRTRIAPYCHTDDILLTIGGYCPSNSPSIAKINDSSSLTGQIVVSFLTGTNAWQTVGQAIEDNPVASTLGGINIEAQDAFGTPQGISRAALQTRAGTVNLSVNSGAVAYTEGVAPNTPDAVQAQTAGGAVLNATATLPATTVLPLIVKPGPVISRVLPAASAVFPLHVAPGSFVAIYGSGLDNGQVLVNGAPAQVVFASPAQINMIYPDAATGLTQLTVKNDAGRQTVNVLTAPALPAIFTLDSSGHGPAAAVNPAPGTIVTAANPLHGGDYVSLYLTGLGATMRQNGLDYAVVQPLVTLGGVSCPVSYAGRAPTLAGLDQINCRIPQSGVGGVAVPVVVSSGGTASNTVTLAIQ